MDIGKERDPHEAMEEWMDETERLPMAPETVAAAPRNAGRRLKIGSFSSSCNHDCSSDAASFVFSIQSNP